MGEAKRRGDFETRAAEARARIEAQRPKSIVCNGCRAELTPVRPVEVKPIAGLDAVFAASCAACEADTYVALGTPEALKVFADFMQANTDPESLLGSRLRKARL